VPAALFSTDGKPGVRAAYLKGDIATFLAAKPDITSSPRAPSPVSMPRPSRCPPRRRRRAPRHSLGNHTHAAVHRRLRPRPPGRCFFRVSLDGKIIANADDTTASKPELAVSILKPANPARSLSSTAR